MSFQCLNPYCAVSLYEKTDGKKVLKLFSKTRQNYNLQDLKRQFGSENVFVLPCGTCESCRRNSAEEWAIRCSLEAKMHQYNYFLTLTFDDFHIKKASPDDLKLFFDRLSGHGHKRSFKRFCCMEFGELTHRLHFHCVLFCDFEIDLHSPIKCGQFYQYKSNLIDSCWNYGHYTLSPFETNCARYVAKYTAKDSKLFMSRNLGKSYFLDHYEEIIKDGFRVYGDFGGKFSSYIPSCFVRWFEEIEPGIAGDFVSFKKNLAHIVQAEKMRNLQTVHEEDSMHFEAALIKEKGQKKKRL